MLFKVFGVLLAVNCVLAFEANCSLKFSDLGYSISTVICPAGCWRQSHSLCGTGSYGDGPVCLAAIHAGVISDCGGVSHVYETTSFNSSRGSLSHTVRSSTCGPEKKGYTFQTEASLHSNQCVIQEKINEEGQPKTFYICPNEQSMHHICDKTYIPFEMWYHNVSLFKRFTENSSVTAMWINKTLLDDCDPAWQEPSLAKYQFCNRNITPDGMAEKKLSLLEPSYFQFLVWIMAIFAVVGNLIVFRKSWLFLKREFTSMSEVQKIHQIMLINLALADFLMGTYLLAIAISAAVFNQPGDQWRLVLSANSFCNFLGVLSLVSSQMSVTVLVIMTSFRLHSVLRPFYQMNAKTAVVAVVCCWILWIMLASIPLLDIILATRFFQRLFVKSCKSKPTFYLYSYRNIRQLLDGFLESVGVSCGSSSNHSLWLSDSVQRQQVLTKAQHLKLVNEKPLQFNYYSQSNICSPTYFMGFSNYSEGYSSSMLVFNFLSFFYMLLAYCVIWFKASNSNSCVSCFGESTGRNSAGEREKENRRLFRKVLLIILTDFCCWMPICIFAFWFRLHFSDLQVPETCDNMLQVLVSLPIFITIFLPINSALNPVLFSAAPWDWLNRVFRCGSSLLRNSGLGSQENSNTQSVATSVVNTVSR